MLHTSSASLFRVDVIKSYRPARGERPANARELWKSNKASTCTLTLFRGEQEWAGQVDALERDFWTWISLQCSFVDHRARLFWDQLSCNKITCFNRFHTFSFSAGRPGERCLLRCIS